jgi:hypothetical protein
MSLKVIIIRDYLINILSYIQTTTDKIFMIFSYDKITVKFTKFDETSQYIDIEYKSYFHNLFKNQANVIKIEIDLLLFLFDITRTIKREFIQLSFNRDDDIMKIKSTDE